MESIIKTIGTPVAWLRKRIGLPGTIIVLILILWFGAAIVYAVMHQTSVPEIVPLHD